MNDTQIQAQAYGYFLAEAPELLQTIEQEILTLPNEHTTAKVHNLMRALHTLKGAAANVGLATIERIAHDFEDVARVFYNLEVTIDLPIQSLLLDGYSGLQECLDAQIMGKEIDDSAIADRLAMTIVQLKSILGDWTEADIALPTAMELGFDIVASIFETTVQEQLDLLSSIITTQDSTQISACLYQTTEMFIGLGESFELPGFVEIDRAIITAIELHPDRLESIAYIALTNLRQAQIEVLAGDRVIGGSIRPDLLKFIQSPAGVAARPEGAESTTDWTVDTAPSDFAEFAVDWTQVEPTLELAELTEDWTVETAPADFAEFAADWTQVEPTLELAELTENWTVETAPADFAEFAADWTQVEPTLELAELTEDCTVETAPADFAEFAEDRTEVEPTLELASALALDAPVEASVPVVVEFDQIFATASGEAELAGFRAFLTSDKFRTRQELSTETQALFDRLLRLCWDWFRQEVHTPHSQLNLELLVTADGLADLDYLHHWIGLLLQGVSTPADRVSLQLYRKSCVYQVIYAVAKYLADTNPIYQITPELLAELRSHLQTTVLAYKQQPPVRIDERGWLDRIILPHHWTAATTEDPLIAEIWGQPQIAHESRPTSNSNTNSESAPDRQQQIILVDRLQALLIESHHHALQQYQQLQQLYSEAHADDLVQLIDGSAQLAADLSIALTTASELYRVANGQQQFLSQIAAG